MKHEIIWMTPVRTHLPFTYQDSHDDGLSVIQNSTLSLSLLSVSLLVDEDITPIRMMKAMKMDAT